MSELREGLHQLTSDECDALIKRTWDLESDAFDKMVEADGAILKILAGAPLHTGGRKMLLRRLRDIGKVIRSFDRA